MDCCVSDTCVIAVMPRNTRPGRLTNFFGADKGCLLQRRRGRLDGVVCSDVCARGMAAPVFVMWDVVCQRSHVRNARLHARRGARPDESYIARWIQEANYQRMIMLKSRCLSFVFYCVWALSSTRPLLTIE